MDAQAVRQDAGMPPRLEQAIPWLVLAALALFSLTLFFFVPYLGFRFVPSGEIVEVYVEDGAPSNGAPSNGDLAAGDQIVAFGPLSWSEFQEDLNSRLEVGPRGSVITLQLLREGRPLTVEWVLPGPTAPEVLQQLNSEWWLAYVFWLAGTLSWLLVRPKGSLWWLLAAFNYLTALWLAAGGVSAWHIGLSVFVLQAAVWLSVPVYLHLHWEFPYSLRRLPRVAPGALYAGAFALVLAEWFHLPPPDAYQQGLLLALLGSLLIIVFRLIRRPNERRELGYLGLALALALIPLIAATLIEVTGIAATGVLQGGAVLALPALPAAYFFTIYRRQLAPPLQTRTNRLIRLYFLAVVLTTGLILLLSVITIVQGLSGAIFSIGLAVTILVVIVAVLGFVPLLATPALSGAYRLSAADPVARAELRVNRLISPYLFFALLAAMAAGVGVLVTRFVDFPGDVVVVSLALALSAALATHFGYHRFEQVVDRRLLGISLPPAKLMSAYAGRVATVLDERQLRGLITAELLPSLTIREATILTADPEDNLTPFCRVGEATTGEQGRAGFPVAAEADRRPTWVRLALPLMAGDEQFGVWWFGRRDPDDLYSRAELPFFQAVVDQTAVALINIRQAALLQTLYRQDVNRNEAERSRLARALHDDVLNELGVLAMHSAQEEVNPAFQESFEHIVSRLRQVIAGLRPVMLQYGLWVGLEELVGEVNERNVGGARLYLEAAGAEFRYPEQVELQLYRIVQQAVANAQKHAQADAIIIGGELEADRVELFVQDDGVGFPVARQLDLGALLADRHFGLAGMYERAALIEATLTIEAAPGKGARVSVIWKDDTQRML